MNFSVMEEIKKLKDECESKPLRQNNFKAREEYVLKQLKEILDDIKNGYYDDLDVGNALELKYLANSSVNSF